MQGTVDLPHIYIFLQHYYMPPSQKVARLREPWDDLL